MNKKQFFLYSGENLCCQTEQAENKSVNIQKNLIHIVAPLTELMNHLESDKCLRHAHVCCSMEMMGHHELRTEFNIDELEPLLPQDVVDDLLSKYVQTFTVRTMSCLINLIHVSLSGLICK